MEIAYKILGQVSPSATTATTLYATPSSKSAVCSTLSICNCGADATVRVAVVKDGAVGSNANYIVYDCPISQYDTVFLTIGVTLAAGDYVSVYASTADVAFGLFGSEVG